MFNQILTWRVGFTGKKLVNVFFGIGGRVRNGDIDGLTIVFLSGALRVGGSVTSKAKLLVTVLAQDVN